MRILILGGTQFVGRHVVETLIYQGHEVTLVNRGKTAPNLFQSARRIVCDRGQAEFNSALKNETGFDAVVDFCAYYPADVERLLPILPGLTGHYIQISSVSAYSAIESESISFIRDDDPLLECTPEQALDKTDLTYGRRKAKCDRLVLQQSRTGVPTTVFRPSLIYGKYDPTDRFAYWVWRVFSKKPFILPDDGLCITRRTYAPDFAATIIKAIACKSAFHQSYNFAEVEALNLRLTLKTIGDQLGIDPFEFAIPVSSKQLADLKVKSWSDLPMWIPQTNLMMDVFKVRRDLEPTETKARDAIRTASEEFLSLGRPPIAGLSSQAEQEIIDHIRAKAGK